MDHQLRELYQQVIIDHGRKPRHFNRDSQATHMLEGYNPLCGDQITFYLRAPQGEVDTACFYGSGCAISLASASLLAQMMQGQGYSQAYLQKLFQHFQELVTQGYNETINDSLEKLAVLGGVAEFPSRVKCATLAWHTVLGALKGQQQQVTTE